MLVERMIRVNAIVQCRQKLQAGVQIPEYVGDDVNTKSCSLPGKNT